MGSDYLVATYKIAADAGIEAMEPNTTFSWFRKKVQTDAASPHNEPLSLTWNPPSDPYNPQALSLAIVLVATDLLFKKPDQTR